MTYLWQEIYQAYKTLKEMFGNNIAKYLIVVFTRADILDGETYGRYTFSMVFQLM